MAGPDGIDTGCEASVLGEPTQVSFEAMRVLDVPDNGLLGISKPLRAAQQRAAAHLASRGALVEEKRFKRLRKSIEIWSSMLAEAGGSAFEELLGNGHKMSLGAEFGRCNDHVTIAVAMELERAFGGWVRPSRPVSVRLASQ